MGACMLSTPILVVAQTVALAGADYVSSGTDTVVPRSFKLT